MSTKVNLPKNRSPRPFPGPAPKWGERLAFERRLTFLALFCGGPAVMLCALLLWVGDYTARAQWTIDLLLVCLWLGVAFNLYRLRRRLPLELALP